MQNSAPLGSLVIRDKAGHGCDQSAEIAKVRADEQGTEFFDTAKAPYKNEKCNKGRNQEIVI